MKSKLINILIIVSVTAGTAIIPLVSGAASGVEPLKSIFFAFVSAIIAIQLVPALMLLWYFVKSIVFDVREHQEN